MHDDSDNVRFGYSDGFECASYGLCPNSLTQLIAPLLTCFELSSANRLQQHNYRAPHSDAVSEPLTRHSCLRPRESHGYRRRCCPVSHEKEGRRSKMKAQALKECDPIVAKFAECAKGRTFSVIWACRAQSKETNACLHQYTNDEAFAKYKKQYEEEISQKL